MSETRKLSSEPNEKSPGHANVTFGSGFSTLKFSDLAKKNDKPKNIWAESTSIDDNDPVVPTESQKIEEQPTLTGEEHERAIFEVHFLFY